MLICFYQIRLDPNLQFFMSLINCSKAAKLLTKARGGDILASHLGAVAQFGRAPAWHAGGQEFNPPRLHIYFFAKVAELVYALVSKTSGLTAVRVRFPPLAPIFYCKPHLPS